MEAPPLAKRATVFVYHDVEDTSLAHLTANDSSDAPS